MPMERSAEMYREVLVPVPEGLRSYLGYILQRSLHDTPLIPEETQMCYPSHYSVRDPVADRVFCVEFLSVLEYVGGHNSDPPTGCKAPIDPSENHYHQTGQHPPGIQDAVHVQLPTDGSADPGECFHPRCDGGRCF